MIFDGNHKVILESLNKEEAEVYVQFLRDQQFRYELICGDINGDSSCFRSAKIYNKFAQSEIDILKDKIKRIDLKIDTIKLRKGL